MLMAIAQQCEGGIHEVTQRVCKTGNINLNIKTDTFLTCIAKFVENSVLCRIKLKVHRINVHKI